MLKLKQEALVGAFPFYLLPTAASIFIFYCVCVVYPYFFHLETACLRGKIKYAGWF